MVETAWPSSPPRILTVCEKDVFALTGDEERAIATMRAVDERPVAPRKLSS